MTYSTKLSLFFLGLILVSTALYTSCSTSVGDDEEPATIDDLEFDALNNRFTWTAPGDDGNSGTATIYDLRFLEDEEVAQLLGLSLDDFNAMYPVDPDTVDPDIEEVVRDNFEDATQIRNEPEPNEAGTPESFILAELDVEEGKRLFFALTARDEVGNSSSPSNVVEVQTPLASAALANSAGGSCFGESIGHGDLDGDGINDVLFVRGGGIKAIAFSVYDRWGTKVFESTSQDMGWDGTYKGKELDPAVYVYVLTATCYSDENFIFKGNVTLLK